MPRAYDFRLPLLAAGVYILRRRERARVGRPNGRVHERPYRSHGHDPRHAIGEPSIGRGCRGGSSCGGHGVIGADCHRVGREHL